MHGDAVKAFTAYMCLVFGVITHHTRHLRSECLNS